MLFGITITSVAVVLPQMKGSLSATQDQISWILTFNIVSTAVLIPMTGWLASKFGWRTLMVGSIIGFTSASVLCGAANSLETLLAYRIVQGAFGAPIFPLGQAILLASFPKSKHALVLMLWGVGGVMGPILGPTFGGLIAEVLNWRWCFFFILPLGVVSGVIAYISLPNREKGTSGPFDYLGFIFIGIAVGSLQLMVDRGQRLDWFASTEILVELTLAGLFFYLFVIHILTSRSSIIEGKLFVNWNFSIGIFFACVMGMLQYTPMIIFPSMLQEIGGYPNSVVGYLIASRGLGNFLSFFIVTQFTRFSPRFCLFTGMALQTVAGIWMTTFDINVGGNLVFMTNLLHGFGFGLAYTPMAVLTFSTLDRRLLTQGNAVFSLLRMLGSSIFIALTLVVFTKTSQEAGVNLSSFVTAFDGEGIGNWVLGGGILQGAQVSLNLGFEIKRQSEMIGYLNAFSFLALLSACVIPMVLLFHKEDQTT